MAQAIIDPDEVRNFALYLKTFNDALAENFKTISSRLDILGNTWRDQEYLHFREEFNLTANQITHYLPISKEFVNFLYRKAKAADEYLDQR